MSTSAFAVRIRLVLRASFAMRGSLDFSLSHRSKTWLGIRPSDAGRWVPVSMASKICAWVNPLAVQASTKMR